MEQFHKKITIRLNKITMDNFETLAGQIEAIFDSEITSTAQLEKLVTLIFEKTVQEHVYGPLYARLCVTLSSKEKAFDEVDFDSNSRRVTKQVDFKNVLVKVCQLEFQKGKRPPTITPEMDAQDIENETIKVKKILLGTMKFIGQLYLSDLLPPRVMTLCLKHLVLPTGSKPTNDDVEGACTLMVTVGKELDTEQQLKGEVNKYYQRLSTLARGGHFEPRIKILIRNLLELRKKGWSDSRAQVVEGPKSLTKRKKRKGAGARDAHYDYDEDLPIMMEEFIGGADDAMEMITGSTVPISASVVGQSERKFNTVNRYQSGQSGKGLGDKHRPSRRRRAPRDSASSNRRILLQTEEEEDDDHDHDDGGGAAPFAAGSGYGTGASSFATPTAAAGPSAGGGSAAIGRRKTRLSLSRSAKRPCSEGKEADEEKLGDIMGEYLGGRVNEQSTLKALQSYRIEDRSKFILSIIRRAVDGGKGERLSQLVPKLLDQYILVPSELDGAFIEFFKGFTMEDNPQINKLAPQLLAPLLVDNELDFSELMEWVLLDIRANQQPDDLEFYAPGDGVRNFIRGSKTITKALELIGYLFREMKEVCFEDQDYVKKLLAAHSFAIDRFMDQNSISNKEAVKEEWVGKYNLKFAF